MTEPKLENSWLLPVSELPTAKRWGCSEGYFIDQCNAVKDYYEISSLYYRSEMHG